MANINENNYLSITAMLAAREARMLTAERMERMLDAPTTDEAAKVLEECGCGDLSGMDANAVSAALEQRIADVFNDLANLAPEKAVAELFRLKYDYHNIKVLIKAQAAGVDGANLLSRRASVTPEVLRTAFETDEYAAVPSALAAAMQDAAGILARTANPQLADFALDRSYFAELHRLAASVRDDGFAAKYVRLLIDSANLGAAVRTARMGKDAEFLRMALVPGGEISEGRVLAASESAEALAGLYQQTRLQAAAEAGAAALSGGSLTAFERACDNAVMAFIRDAKIMRVGASHVIAYLAAMESEVTAARMILTGRLAGLDAGVIRERLRDTYA